MLRWLLLVTLALMVFQWAWPWMHRFGLGRLPLDWRFRTLGKEWVLPLGSALVVTALLTVLERLFWHFS